MYDSPLQVYLALVGVFGIGLASLVSYGFASAIGMFYGPIHPILPFLLLGKPHYTPTVQEENCHSNSSFAISLMANN